MKNIFLTARRKLGEISAIKYTSKDFGQIDKYTDRPPVKLPCALISVSLPKRQNISQNVPTQRRTATITIRLAFQRFFEANNIIDDAQLNIALEYYDVVEEVDNLLQGFKEGDMTAWECISCIEEQRADLDVMRFTFTTSYIK